MRLAAILASAIAILGSVCVLDALAEGGSAGGSIGNSDKSVSGGQDSDEPAQNKTRKSRARATDGEGGHKRSSLCGSLSGRYSANTGANVSISGSSTKTNTGYVGTLTCSGNSVVIKWKGFGDPVDRLQISADGKQLNGSNNYGFALTYSRN